MKIVDAMVGNSSSGVLEAPSIPLASVNIGDRQKGRQSADSVINCGPETNTIVDAIKTCLNDQFKGKLDAKNTPYGEGKFAEQAVKLLKSVNLDDLRSKPFYDVNV